MIEETQIPAGSRHCRKVLAIDEARTHAKLMNLGANIEHNALCYVDTFYRSPSMGANVCIRLRSEDADGLILKTKTDTLDGVVSNEIAIEFDREQHAQFRAVLMATGCVESHTVQRRVWGYDYAGISIAIERFEGKHRGLGSILSIEGTQLEDVMDFGEMLGCEPAYLVDWSFDRMCHHFQVNK